MRVPGHETASRAVAPETACVWNPADCYVMTGTLLAAPLAPEKVNAAAGLTVGLLPVWILHCVSGKNNVYITEYGKSQEFLWQSLGTVVSVRTLTNDGVLEDFTFDH